MEGRKGGGNRERLALLGELSSSVIHTPFGFLTAVVLLLFFLNVFAYFKYY